VGEGSHPGSRPPHPYPLLPQAGGEGIEKQSRPETGDGPEKPGFAMKVGCDTIRGDMGERRTRIAYLITDLDIGGAERNLQTLVTRLDRRRFEVSVASLMPVGRIAEELRAAGVAVTAFNMTNVADLRALPRVAAWLRRARPDLLHTWLFHANFLGRIAAAAARTPAVVSSIRVAEPRRWHLLFERLTSRLADVILANSPSLRDYMIGRGIASARLRVVPNGVDLGRFSARRPGRAHTTATVLFVGRLDRQKGVDVLLRSAAALAKRCDFRLDLVGEGPDRVKLARLAERLKLTNVRFLGRSERVSALLAQADVLVLPSRWEGLPNIVLEAMAARCPVVATDVIGSRDLIEDGVNGLLVPPDDPAALAEALEALIREPSLGGSLASKAYQTARKHSISAMVEAHQRLYLDVLRRL